jgi:hypothetical protein
MEENKECDKGRTENIRKKQNGKCVSLLLSSEKDIQNGTFSALTNNLLC